MAQQLSLTDTITRTLTALGYTQVAQGGTLWRSADKRTGYDVRDSQVVEYNLSLSKPVKAGTFTPMAFLDELQRMLAEASAQSAAAEESVPDFGTAASKPLSDRESGLKGQTAIIAQNAKLMALYTGQPSHWARTNSESMILWSIEPGGAFGHGKSTRKVKFASDTPRVRFETWDADAGKYTVRKGGKTAEGQACLELPDWLNTSDGCAFAPIPNVARATMPADPHACKPEHANGAQVGRKGAVPAAMQNGAVVSKPAADADQPAMRQRVISLLAAVASDHYAEGSTVKLSGGVTGKANDHTYVCDGKLFTVNGAVVKVRVASGNRDEYTVNPVATLPFAEFLAVQCGVGQWAEENGSVNEPAEPEAIEL